MRARSIILLAGAMVVVGDISFAQSPETISPEKALAIAKGDKQFWGTWMWACHGEKQWYVSGFSKSNKPPVLCIIDDTSAKVIYESLNSDDPASFRGVAFNEDEGVQVLYLGKSLHYRTAVTTDEGIKLYVDGIRKWPRNLVGKRLVVTGKLQIRNSAEVPSDAHPSQPTSAAGLISVCSTRGYVVLVHPEWQIAK